MEKIIQTLGGTMLCTIIVLAIYGLIIGGIVLEGNAGLFAIMGKTVEQQTEKQEVSDISLAVVKDLQERERPKVVTVQEAETDRLYSVDELLLATDADEDPAEVFVMKVEKDGYDVTEEILQKDRLIFDQTGTYRFKVRATDTRGISNICHIYVTCNG